MITASDVIYLVNFVFRGGPEPLPDRSTGDCTCSGQVSSGDVISLVGHILKSAPEPQCP